MTCSLLVAMATTMATSSLALVGDGAYYLVRILGSEQIFGSDARIVGNAIRQGPVLIGLRLGVTDTHLLSVLLGVGQLIVPAAVWCYALVLARVHALAFSAVAMTAGLCAGTTWYFSVSENVLAIPLTALVAVILWRPDDWTWQHAVVAVGASSILVASYEAVVLTGPTLALWAGWRGVVSRSAIDRYGAALVSFTAALSIAVGYRGIIFDRPSSHSQSLLYFVVSLEPWQFYLALASCAALIAAITLRDRRIPSRLLLGAGILGAAVAIFALTPSARVAFAARGGAAIAALILELFLFWLWARNRPSLQTQSGIRPSSAPQSPEWLLLTPVLFVAGMTLANLPAVHGWSRSLDAFREEVDKTRGPTQVHDVLPEDGRHVLWGWTSSSLSLIVRNSADAGILVDTTPSLVPFPPESARDQIADKYTWRS